MHKHWSKVLVPESSVLSYCRITDSVKTQAWASSVTAFRVICGCRSMLRRGLWAHLHKTCYAVFFIIWSLL